MIERTIILDVVIKIIVLLVTAVLLPAVKSFIDRNKDNVELDLVLKIASVAVTSVEIDLKTETGEMKKGEAFKRLAQQISGWGLKGFTPEELNHYIDTAFKAMKKSENPAVITITE